MFGSEHEVCADDDAPLLISGDPLICLWRSVLREIGDVIFINYAAILTRDDVDVFEPPGAHVFQIALEDGQRFALRSWRRGCAIIARFRIGAIAAAENGRGHQDDQKRSRWPKGFSPHLPKLY